MNIQREKREYKVKKQDIIEGGNRKISGRKQENLQGNTKNVQRRIKRIYREETG